MVVAVGGCRRAVVARCYERRRIGTPHGLRPIRRLCGRWRPIVGRRVPFDVLLCRLARRLGRLLALRRRELVRMIDFRLSRRLRIRVLALRRRTAAVPAIVALLTLRILPLAIRVSAATAAPATPVPPAATAATTLAGVLLSLTLTLPRSWPRSLALTRCRWPLAVSLLSLLRVTRGALLLAFAALLARAAIPVTMTVTIAIAIAALAIPVAAVAAVAAIRSIAAAVASIAAVAISVPIPVAPMTVAAPIAAEISTASAIPVAFAMSVPMALAAVVISGRRRWSGRCWREPAEQERPDRLTRCGRFRRLFDDRGGRRRGRRWYRRGRHDVRDCRFLRLRLPLDFFVRDARIGLRLHELVARAGVLGKLNLVVTHAAQQVVRRLEIRVADDHDRDAVGFLQRLHPVALLVQHVVCDVHWQLADDFGGALLARFLADEA